MSVLRDIFRRKWRSILTISGVAVGIFALVVLGAVAERANLSVKYIGDFYDKTVTVVDENDAGVFGLGGGNRPIDPASLKRIRELPGVARVDEGVSLLLDDSAIMIGVPAMILGGGSLATGERLPGRFQLEPTEGRLLHEGDRGVALVGRDLVAQLSAKAGGTVTLRGEKFEVAGVLRRTNVQAVDQAVIVPLADAQELFVHSLPDAFQSRVTPADLVLTASVVMKDGADADEVAGRINKEIEGVLATGPSKLRGQVGQLLVLFNLVAAAVGFVALLVGALSVVNTMLVAVSERTRETGVKRALGATGWRIARDVLAESALMSGLGGAFGLAAGAAAVSGINAVTSARAGTVSMMMTARLSLGVLAFAVVLGVFGGAYPARYAARLDPVDALARE